MEAPPSPTTEKITPVQWKMSSRRRQRSGYSNIFTGVNLHQLHRLFRKAGDKEAKHRAKLVWQGMGVDADGEDEEREEDRVEGQDDETLVRALVGLRLRGRNKAGIRTEGNRDQNWVRASGNLRIEEQLSDFTAEKVVDETPSCTEESAIVNDRPEYQKPFKPLSWRLDFAREECARQSERYLHRILH